MMDRFLAADPIRRANFSVVYQPAERGELPPDFSCDLIFTSPPFFNFEVYTDIPGQSIDQWRSVPEWLVRFLFVCLNRFWVHLEPGGHMVIHLNDARKMQICEPMCLFAEARLAGCRFAGVFGAKGGVSGKTRPLWVFKKEPVDSADLVGRRKAEAEAHLRTHFHAVHSILATVDLDQLARGVAKRSRDDAVADADSAGASAPRITEAAPKRIALATTQQPLPRSHSNRSGNRTAMLCSRLSKTRALWGGWARGPLAGPQRRSTTHSSTAKKIWRCRPPSGPIFIGLPCTNTRSSGWCLYTT
jgi:hypothetical protein